MPTADGSHDRPATLGRRQFSLRSLLLIVTGFGVFFGIPGGVYLVGNLIVPLLIGAGLLLVLMLLQFPLFYWVARRYLPPDGSSPPEEKHR